MIWLVIIVQRVAFAGMPWRLCAGFRSLAALYVADFRMAHAAVDNFR